MDWALPLELISDSSFDVEACWFAPIIGRVFRMCFPFSIERLTRCGLASAQLMREARLGSVASQPSSWAWLSPA